MTTDTTEPQDEIGERIDPDFPTLIMAHRKASMTLGQVMQTNGRRGGSQSSADEINRAGYAMAKTERDLMDAISRRLIADKERPQ